MTDALLLLDESGRVRAWNDRAAELFAPRGPLAVLSNEAALVSRLAEAAARGVATVTIEADVLRPVRLTLRPLRSEPGTARFFAAEAGATAAAPAPADAVAAELQALHRSLSHDVRAPLRAIVHLAEVLASGEERLSPAQRAEMASAIHASAVKMAGLLDDLALLSRASRTPPTRTRLDLTRLAREALEAILPRLGATATRVEVAEGLVAEGDEALVRAALERLLSNAVKFSAQAERPLVQVGIASTSKGDAFFVRDNGAGFDPALSSRLFQPFQRLHASHQYAGAGLGLATAARIVRAHGGDVWAEGAPGAGATFYFSLPPTGK